MFGTQRRTQLGERFGLARAWRKGGAATAAVFLAVLLISPAAAQDCVGDCNGDDEVAVNELIVGVNIALGNQEVTSCEAFDANDDGEVTISELIQGVSNALNQCGPVGPTDTPEPTATPTPTEEPGEPLGERVLTVRGDSIPMADSRSSLQVSVLPVPFPNVASAIRSQPITLVAGVPGADGKAPLSLAEDVFIAVEVPLFSDNPQEGVLCMKIIAEGSEGWIDCDGGPAPDVVVTRATGSDPTLPSEVSIEEGEETGPGAAVLEMVLLGNMEDSLPLGSGPEGCSAITFPVIIETAFTTGIGTAIKGEQTISVAGENFSCEEWTISEGDGMLVAPMPQYHPLPHDISAILRLADK